MKAFWIDLFKRTLKTACETAVGIIGGSLLFSEIDFNLLASAVTISAIVTILINLPNIPLGEGE